ncbi:inositol monophosphatase family protein [Pseudodesulfovibrio sp.]|uniref:inositol monophosphatase family protein n=1 Tax=Pseudodesulfovibrio sp. TaxID=2035812 RepID=UPI002611F2BB|nr:inositol monophosphatase family protein [Pseudodesulfovibrio sp.]MDD3313293.1 inositol monophosphatase family protein [Pseudodesulfovibrio sp.]
MHDETLTGLLPGLEAAVRKAGDLVVEHSARRRNITHKGRIDLVTETDVAVEELLKEQLHRLLPEADFLAEESASGTEPGELTWIIDPLDGTTNFAHGLPFVANSVGLWHRDRVVLGAVNLPLLGELFCAARGQGTRLNGRPVTVSAVENLDDALLATGFPYAIEEHLDTILRHFKTLLPLAQGIRRPGAAALDLAYVACGRYDGFYESALHPWDTAAGILLITEAGGRVSEYEAEKPYGFGSGTILATNGRLHERLSGLLGQA